MTHPLQWSGYAFGIRITDKADKRGLMRAQIATLHCGMVISQLLRIELNNQTTEMILNIGQAFVIWPDSVS